MNHKRHKPRRKVRCVICTPGRDGNMENSKPLAVRRANEEARLDFR